MPVGMTAVSSYVPSLDGPLADRLERYRTHLESQPFAAATRRTYAGQVAGFLAWLAELDRVTWRRQVNPFAFGHARDYAIRDLRSRRRRTIPKDQLALALDGAAEHAYAHSFIVTNIPADDGDIAGLEAWFRRRTSIEDRFREGKHGTGLHHLPSGQASINTIWAWGALLAGALVTMLQPLIGRRPDHAERSRTPTLRHQLLALPGRILRHARTLTLRLAPGQHSLEPALTMLRALPRPG